MVEHILDYNEKIFFVIVMVCKQKQTKKVKNFHWLDMAMGSFHVYGIEAIRTQTDVSIYQNSTEN